MSDRAALALLAEWLRCPICFSPLIEAGPLALGCENGHRFDVNKRGFVNLLTSRTRVSGDSRAMLDDRAAFLSAGHYARVVEAARRLLRSAAPRATRIADMGCGTGYYLRHLAAEARADRVLATDLSPDAVRMAVREVPRSCGVVCDVWQPLPLRDGCADILLNVFAPRNVSEFARVLSARGVVLSVVPSERHLRELSESGLALSVPEGKRDALLEELAASGLGELLGCERVEYPCALDGDEIGRLVGMGPSAHHRERPESAERTEVTVSVDLIVAGRPAPSAR